MPKIVKIRLNLLKLFAEDCMFLFPDTVFAISVYSRIISIKRRHR